MLAHTALLAALEAALLAAPAVAGGEVARSRSAPVKATAAQAVRLRLLSADPEPLSGYLAPADCTTRVAVECLGRVDSTGDADEAAGQVLQAVHTRLAANAAALEAAGFSLQLYPQLRWDQEDADERIGVVIAIYTVTHRVHTEDLS